jgi:hypothetical protein
MRIVVSKGRHCPTEQKPLELKKALWVCYLKQS